MKKTNSTIEDHHESDPHISSATRSMVRLIFIEDLRDSNGEKCNGWYYRKEMKIEANLNILQKIFTIIHEGIHAILDIFLPEYIDNRFGEFIDDIYGFYIIFF